MLEGCGLVVCNRSRQHLAPVNPFHHRPLSSTAVE